MAKSRAERVKRRITCELLLETRSYRGIVLDLSATGVFVQTEATPVPGAHVRVRFHTPERAEFEVDAKVARRQVVPAQLASVVRGGLGLRIDRPPEAYFRMLGIEAPPAQKARSTGGTAPAAETARQPSAANKVVSAQPKAPAPPPKPVPELPEFRIRVKQTDGPRSRVLKIRAANRDDARRRAIAELGRGWEILAVDAA